MTPFSIRSRSDKRPCHRSKRSCRFAVELLEGRQLLSAFTVTNTNDSGAGSLRQAIISSNSIKGPNTISFDIPGTGLHTITPLSALPTLTQPVTLDGTTEPVSNGQVVIQIDGTKAGSTAVGLGLASTASGSTVKGIAITRFAGGGALLNDASNVALTNDDFGIVNQSPLSLTNGNTSFGVELENGANHDTLSGNVISGQNGDGVVITGVNTSDNILEGSLIGTDPTGSFSVPNTNDGVVIAAGASLNTIGGTTAATRDVISGNTVLGVVITGTGTSDNVVEGDFIGTNAAGTGAVPNHINGVDILSGAMSNTVGGATAGAGDVISGNTFEGIAIAYAGTKYNVVEGDDIGVDVTGANPLANGDDGIQIVGGAIDNDVGGYTAGARNVISGNTGSGVYIAGTGTTGNVVTGDYIGTNAAGTAAVPNGNDGVVIAGGSIANDIGGIASGSRDIISGNAVLGVAITDAGTSGNVVEGDFIGTNFAGKGAVPNGINGVDILNGATTNLVGGTDTGAGNLISGNTYEGIAIAFAGTSQNAVQGNVIGLDVSGLKRLPNGDNGIQILGGATDNTVGGTVAAARNVISGNTNDGVVLSDSGTSGNVVEGNNIGVDATGEIAISNYLGVEIVNGATNNTVGGTSSSARNVLSGNGYAGVLLTSAGTTGNVVEGNFVGTDATGNTALANAEGVVLEGGASSNIIGGPSILARNIISGNTQLGVYVVGSGTNSNMVESNDIGTNSYGNQPLGNGLDGVRIDMGASYNDIGGPSSSGQNVIEYNDFQGVYIGSGSAGNVVESDIISLNGYDGVALYPGDYDNVVIGCLIEANGMWGIQDAGAGNDEVNNTLVNNLDGSIEVI